ncbi:MAG: hypothetical protein WC979_02020 [Candidatus Pacearchaeota archaeon]|jgi:hypothetical protein|nr:hypothetical protein [Clostridia bacterium]
MERRIPSLDEFINEANNNRRYNSGAAVASIGTLNLKTGSSKYFNVYETWPDGTAEIWANKDYNGNIIKTIVVFTAGKKSMKPIGGTQSFKADQSDRPMFEGKPLEIIDSCPNAKLPEFADKYGKSLAAYTYK